MVVYIDTREQLPLPLPNSERKTLNVGDYTTAKLIKSFVIERKAPADLYQSVLKGHARFRREIKRAAAKGITIVVFVECSQKAFYGKTFEGAEFCVYPSEVIKKIIATMQKRYNLRFVWCMSRKIMQGAILRMLETEERKLKRK